MTKKQMPTEWSYQIDTDEISKKTPLKLSITASAESCEALANRLNLQKIDSLTADIVLRREENMVIHVSGTLVADLTQSCVVSAEPVEDHLEESFEAWYAGKDAVISINKARHEQSIKKGNLELPMMDEKDDPEPLIDGKIDLGELVSQHLSLAIKPYPRAQGYETKEEIIVSSGPEASFKNPFAALKEWKNRIGKSENT